MPYLKKRSQTDFNTGEILALMVCIVSIPLYKTEFPWQKLFPSQKCQIRFDSLLHSSRMRSRNLILMRYWSFIKKINS